jgi:hypothetical protein
MLVVRKKARGGGWGVALSDVDAEFAGLEEGISTITVSVRLLAEIERGTDLPRH